VHHNTRLDLVMAKPRKSRKLPRILLEDGTFGYPQPENKNCLKCQKTFLSYKHGPHFCENCESLRDSYLYSKRECRQLRTNSGLAELQELDNF